MHIAKKLQHFLGSSRFLRWIDSKLLINNDNHTPEPIFIIGAPRVGSTYLFQALVARYQFAYLTNLHSLFFAQPCLAEYFVKILRFSGIRHTTRFHSEFGYTPGVLAPSEAGPTFRLWFGEADHLLGSHVTDCRRIRKTIATLTKMSEGPFLSKNLFNSMRLQEILRCYPKAFLIWIKRDRNDTARSILKMRQDLYHSIEKWVSVQVPGQNEILQLEPEKQVLVQINLIEQNIKKNFSRRENKYNYIVEYKTFCSSPKRTVDAIITAYNSATGIYPTLKKK